MLVDIQDVILNATAVLYYVGKQDCLNGRLNTELPPDIELSVKQSADTVLNSSIFRILPDI